MSDSLLDTKAFVCNLAVMSDQERARHREAGQKVFASVQGNCELSDGYCFSVDQSAWLSAAEFAMRERQCCAFFNFKLMWEPGKESFIMEITGQEGVKEFIKAELGDAWLKVVKEPVKG